MQIFDKYYDLSDEDNVNIETDKNAESSMPIEAVQKLQAVGNASQQDGGVFIGKSTGDSHSEVYQMDPAQADAM